MKTSSLVAVLVVILIVLGLGYYLYAHGRPASVEEPPVTVGTNTAQQASTTVASSYTVMYDGANFSPATLTIPVGATVTWIDTTGDMWVASNPHPTHTAYDGTSAAEHCAVGYTGPKPFDMCAAGQHFTFTFDKAGTWGYHDHRNHAAGGTIIVQ